MMAESFPSMLFWKVSGNYFLVPLLASHVVHALAASVSHHDVVSTQLSQLFLHSLLGTYLMCSKWRNGADLGSCFILVILMGRML